MFWKKQKSLSQPATPASKIPGETGFIPDGPSPPPQQNPTLDSIIWDETAKQALEQAVSSAPAPALMKGTIKKQLAKAAEDYARQRGHPTITAEDLIQGMLAKLPANLRQKVENAMQQGPEGLEELKKNLGKK